MPERFPSDHHEDKGALRSALEKVYSVAGVNNVRDLVAVYDQNDAELRRSGLWDYDNPNLLTNKIKLLLEDIDVETLNTNEKHWRQEILWFWYHHAISCAVWMKHDKVAAQSFAQEALARQPSPHPNKITRLLFYLVNDRLRDAERFIADVKDESELKSGRELIDEYKRGEFFGRR